MEQQIHKLSDLNIPKDETNMFFNCPQEKQSNLVNRTFLVCDYREGVETRFSRQGGEKKGKTLVFIKFHANDPESESRKFFTGSKDILYTLRQLGERNAFPCQVTLKMDGQRFWFE